MADNDLPPPLPTTESGLIEWGELSINNQSAFDGAYNYASTPQGFAAPTASAATWHTTAGFAADASTGYDTHELHNSVDFVDNIPGNGADFVRTIAPGIVVETGTFGDDDHQYVVVQHIPTTQEIAVPGSLIGTFSDQERQHAITRHYTAEEFLELDAGDETMEEFIAARPNMHLSYQDGQLTYDGLPIDHISSMEAYSDSGVPAFQFDVQGPDGLTSISFIPTPVYDPLQEAYVIDMIRVEDPISQEAATTYFPEGMVFTSRYLHIETPSMIISSFESTLNELVDWRENSDYREINPYRMSPSPQDIQEFRDCIQELIDSPDDYYQTNPEFVAQSEQLLIALTQLDEAIDAMRESYAPISEAASNNQPISESDWATYQLQYDALSEYITNCLEAGDALQAVPASIHEGGWVDYGDALGKLATLEENSNHLDLTVGYTPFSGSFWASSYSTLSSYAIDPMMLLAGPDGEITASTTDLQPSPPSCEHALLQIEPHECSDPAPPPSTPKNSAKPPVIAI